MKALITISLISASVCTRPSSCSRVNRITSPGSVTRARINERRARIMLASPVNWPGPWTATSVSPRLDGRMISISPALTTKNGTIGSPASMSTSPRAIGRTTPCVAIRAIWTGVRVGNMSASCEALTGGVKRTGAATDVHSGAHDGCVDDVLRDEPDLQLVATDHIAHEQIVGPVVARLAGQAGHRARFLDHDLVCVQEARDLHGRLLAALRRPRYQRRLGDVVRRRDAHASEQLDPLCNRVDQLALFCRMFVEQQVELIEARTRHLPMMLLVEVAQGHGVSEDLVQILNRLLARRFRQRDWHAHKMSVGLDLGRVLMRRRRRADHDCFCVERLHMDLLVTDIAVAGGYSIRVNDAS